VGLTEDELRDFVATSYGRIVAGLTLLCGSPGAAQDAVDEALARAWERSRSSTIESLPAWITTVATRVALGTLRRRQAERRAVERLLSQPRPSAVPAEVAAVDVRRALAALPARQREATVLRYYFDLDIEAIATALGVSSGTVKTSLFRARASLAATLDISEAVGNAN